MTPAATPDRDSAEVRPRLLVISNMFPAPDDPMFGAFVEKQNRALREIGAEVRVVANTRWRRGALENAVKYASLFARVSAAALRRDFDVIVAHYLYPTAWFARVASRLSGRPYVLVVHGTDVNSVQREDFFGRRGRAALREASLVVCVSRALASRVRGELGLPASVPIEVINTGIDRSVFRPVPSARDLLGIPQAARVVLFAGNLTRQKNLEVLIPAFAEARRAGAADLMLIAGADKQGRTPELEALAREHGAGDAVRFLGVLTGDRLAAAMTAADVFVLPSLYEGLGMVLLEAMSCGTPVVGSRVGGVPEVVCEECGRLVDPEDVEGFAAAIADVIAAGKTAYAQACERIAAENDALAMAGRLADAATAVGREERA